MLAAPAWAQVPATAEAPRPAPKLSGYIQARETYRKGPGLTATLNRARLGADGSVKPNLAYRVLVEFAAVSGTSGTVSLRDAYLRWTRGWLSVTGGQFKTPFSREYLTSITQIETADRSVAVDSLAPKRDIGVMAEATKPFGSLSAGVFNGEGQNVVANRDSTVMLVGRAVLRPPGPVWIAGDIAERGSHRRTLGAEANFEYRGALVRSEYLAARVDGRARDHYGWFVLGGYRVLPWSAGDRAPRRLPAPEPRAHAPHHRHDRGPQLRLPRRANAPDPRLRGSKDRRRAQAQPRLDRATASPLLVTRLCLTGRAAAF